MIAKTETLDKAKTLIEKGMHKAAQSMGHFTKSEVNIVISEVQFSPIHQVAQIVKGTDKDAICVLKTEIIGDVKGVCYLTFSQTEVDKLAELSLPKSILQDAEKRAMMSKEVMLEIDNIIVASVVTEFANSLNCSMFGGVPHFEMSTVSDFTEQFGIVKNNGPHVLYFKSDFSTSGTNVNPDFIWLLDEHYLTKIEEAE